MKFTENEVVIMAMLRTRGRAMNRNQMMKGTFDLDDIIRWLRLEVHPHSKTTRAYWEMQRRHRAAYVIRNLAGKVGNAGGRMVRTSMLGRGRHASYTYTLPSHKALKGA